MAAMARRVPAVALLACMLLLAVSGASAQEKGDDDLVARTMALDIASADYYALVAWVRSLGLADTGTAQELRARLYAHFGASPPAAATASSKIITIKSADSTEYLSAKEDGESLVRFSGRVAIEVTDSDTGESLKVNADTVVVNRDAHVLSARGDVIF